MDVLVLLVAAAASVVDPLITLPCILWGALFRRVETALLVAFAWVVVRDVAVSLLFHQGAQIPPQALTAHVSAGVALAAASWLAAQYLRAWRAARAQRAERR